MNQQLRALIIEDSENDTLLIARTLRRGGYDLNFEQVDTAEEMRAALARQLWDIIICDYTMPKFSGLAALDLLKDSGLDVPLIIVSGTIGETAAVAAMKAGAHDYVMKDNLPRLIPVIQRELEETKVRRERCQAEQDKLRLQAQVEAQAQQMQHIVNTIPEGVLLLDAENIVIQANPVAKKDLKVLANAQIGDKLTHLGGRSIKTLQTSPPKGFWHKVQAKGRSFEIIAKPVEARADTSGWVLVIRDVTREQEITQRMRQQERLSAVGQLAAGIAHDFNNIMTVITLYTHLMLRTPDLSDKLQERLNVVAQQALRASDLIEQILDFSRSTVLEKHPLDLLPFLKEFIKLLRRTLPEHIEVTLTYGLDQYIVNADPARMQQVLMNLAFNARDAMPQGGALNFALEHVSLEAPETLPVPEMSPGAWIKIAVSDTGVGIPSEIQSKIFDPFFTTKEDGEGTGLGLAQAFGIMKLHEGEIVVESEVGQGTTFTLYLPPLQTSQIEAPPLETEDLAKGQGETILVVEDNTTTREALIDSLDLLNYHVLSAANGQEALSMLEKYEDQVALILSDIVMPEMGGVALLRTINQRGLGVRMVMLTGHPLDQALEELRPLGLVDWMLKPPSMENLADVIAKALRE
jgi:signal transduction histidine kinase